MDVARAFFHLDVPAPPEAELLSYAQQVFGDFDAAAERLLPLADYGIYLAVEEGSLKGGGRIIAAAAAVYLGVGQFGSFMQGVREIHHLGRAVADELVEAATEKPLVHGHQLRWSRRDSGAISELQRLFIRVRDWELSPEEAANRAYELFDGGAHLPASAISEFTRAFESIQRNPEQLALDLDDRRIPPRPQPRQPRPREVPLPSRLVIEIKREARGEPQRVNRKYR